MSENITKLYQKLLEWNKELALLSSTGSILHWDMETKMPPAGIELKSQQLALLQKISHQVLTDTKIGELLDDIEGHRDYEELSKLEKRNIHLSRKAYTEATALPEELVVEIARQQTLGIAAWKKAKTKQDYDMFKPELKKNIDLQKKAAAILMDVKDTKTPYDALIDEYEPNMTSDTITDVFDEMKKGLQKIIDSILSETPPKTEFLRRQVPASTQEKIAGKIARFIDYDTWSEEAAGRIDTTEHPFTTGYYTDVRITTNFHEDYWPSSVYSILHEGGHALYELGLPEEWIYQPVGSSSSYGIHEAMSRFVENHVGRSREFWNYFLPELKKLTGNTLTDITLEQVVAGVNHVTPSKIRIEADEVTYGLHIVIRFEIERDIFAGKITVDELPEIWNNKYEQYLGVEIENDSEGVMQDTHWAGGSFGYFPSYALGNLYDGQLRKLIEKDVPDWKDQISYGNFRPVKTWLTEHVYKHGNLYDPEDLIKLETGNTLRVQPFIDYLDEKFRDIYGY
ncbi:carboxypeptidase M32 [Candidatus Bathyarchaeota archaeon]|nr:carboxypeptidase M32 [Candidatus Bathyarchaeota archaeon]